MSPSLSSDGPLLRLLVTVSTLVNFKDTENRTFCLRNTSIICGVTAVTSGNHRVPFIQSRLSLAVSSGSLAIFAIRRAAHRLTRAARSDESLLISGVHFAKPQDF